MRRDDHRTARVHSPAAAAGGYMCTDFGILLRTWLTHAQRATDQFQSQLSLMHYIPCAACTYAQGTTLACGGLPPAMHCPPDLDKSCISAAARQMVANFKAQHKVMPAASATQPRCQPRACTQSCSISLRVRDSIECSTATGLTTKLATLQQPAQDQVASCLYCTQMHNSLHASQPWTGLQVTSRVPPTAL